MGVHRLSFIRICKPFQCIGVASRKMLPKANTGPQGLCRVPWLFLRAKQVQVSEFVFEFSLTPKEAKPGDLEAAGFVPPALECSPPAPWPAT